jgi:hypothetical protein
VLECLIGSYEFGPRHLLSLCIGTQLILENQSASLKNSDSVRKAVEASIYRHIGKRARKQAELNVVEWICEVEIANSKLKIIFKVQSAIICDS